MNHHLQRLQNGTHHDPFEYLGRHPEGDGEVFRAFMPMAEEVELIGYGPMQRIEGSDLVYDAATLGDGPKRIAGGAAALFIDVTGTPEAPLSFARTGQTARRRVVAPGAD